METLERIRDCSDSSIVRDEVIFAIKHFDQARFFLNYGADRPASHIRLLSAVLEHIAPILKLYEPNLPEHPVIAAIQDYLDKP